METTAHPSSIPDPALAGAPLGLIEKTRVAAAIGASVLILYTMGWIAAQPSDPESAISFVRSGRAIPGIWPALTVLTIVAGIIGTVIAGPRLPEAGLFAAAIGVAGLSIRGGSMCELLANESAILPDARQAFMKAMTVDVALWSALMLATWMAVRWTYRWVWMNEGTLPESQSGAESARSKDAKMAPAAYQLGWGALIASVILGLFIIWMTAGRDPVSPVLRGQTIAAVAAGLYFGAMGGRYFTGVRDVRWYLLAVPAVALLSCLIGYWSADMVWAQGTHYQYYSSLATTPTHDLARPLPIEFIAVGTAAALAGYWAGDKMEQVAQEVT